MEKNKLDAMKTSFKEKLAICGWDRVLNPFIDSPDFETLIINLVEANKNGGITPPFKEIFRAFYECPYKDLNSIIILQDPYPEEGVANGIALCCAKNERVEPYLEVLFEDIQNTVYKDEGSWYLWNPDLSRWSKQGILMLNTALTTEPGKIGTHKNLWKPFTSFLFNRLIELNTGLIYVFMGHAARELANNIPETNYKLFCQHPAVCCKTGKDWESNDIFLRINEILEGANGTKIIW